MDFFYNNFIADFFLFVLRWLYSLINDYSLAIIILTVLMRAMLLPLDMQQRKNSKKMVQIQPELNELKQRYGNNPQMLQQKQSELQKKVGFKPLAGCLPMLLQLPIFFAFFGAMRVLASEQTCVLFLDAVQNGASNTVLPGWLWVRNFWQPDSGLATVLPSATEFITFLQTNAINISPQTLSILHQKGLLTFANGNFGIVEGAYNALTDGILAANNAAGYNNGWFIVPVIAGVGLFFQQKLATRSGTQQDQGKMMAYIMPIFSIWICSISNTAFSVYWVASNLYALGQQSILTFIENRKEKKNSNPQLT